jgi:threonine synthase
MHGVQAAGANPIVAGWRSGGDEIRPVKPSTLVHSLAVGDPPDGPAAITAMRRTGGRADDPTDAESLEGVRLLAETEGLFAETAGGTAVAAARRLAAAGAFSDGAPVVLVITGHGLKTAEAVLPAAPYAAEIDGRLEEWDELWKELP